MEERAQSSELRPGFPRRQEQRPLQEVERVSNTLSQQLAQATT